MMMITVSSISAADTSQEIVSADNADENVMSLDSGNGNNLETENKILSNENSNPGTFTELRDYLSGKSEVTLDRDYAYNSGTDKGLINKLQQGIQLSGFIVIHGNGHTLDAKHKMEFFILVMEAIISALY